jgi:hypothetical protein
MSSCGERSTERVFREVPIRREEKEMAIGEIQIERARAWVLIRAASPEAAAQALYGELGYKEGEVYEPGDSYLPIRADVVDYHYNIVVPVDAEDGDALQALVCRIQKVTGATETAVLRVLAHIPSTPHDADGYITPAEADRFTDDGKVKAGRQKGSPGMNPWG